MGRGVGKPVIRYVSPCELVAESKSAVMLWRFRGKVRALRMPGNIFLKERFASEAELDTVRGAAERLGVRREYNPSSWGSLYHDIAGRPRRPSWTLEQLLPRRCAGAWEEFRRDEAARLAGVRLRLYDLVSAYAWSAYHNLIPVTRTAEPCTTPTVPGIYLARIRAAHYADLPPHLRRPGYHWMTHEEIAGHQVLVEVKRGWTFRSWWDPAERLRRMRETLPEAIWKRCARAYWGAWAAEVGPEVESRATGKIWTLPNPFRDVVAAHFIVSRVRWRVGAYARRAVHIFTDSVVTAQKLPTGEKVGDWMEKHHFAAWTATGAGRWTGRTTSGETVARHAGTA